jgi:hypothetical protein
VRATWLLPTLGTACFAANPLAGVPCDPAAPVCPTDQACTATATGFACVPEGTPPVIDAPPIDAPVIGSCPPDPALSVCFSFDSPMFGNPLANEGRLPLSADLVDVERIARGMGGAAQIGATSSIFVPVNTTIIDIVAVEASIRLDGAVPDGMRVGLVDADATDPGMSMFVFGGPGGTHQLRCSIGNGNLFADLPIAPDAWVDLACSCDANTMSAYVDRVKVGELTGCTPSISTEFGLQIGQDNRNTTGLPPGDPLIGAIDDVRLWTAPLF